MKRRSIPACAGEPYTIYCNGYNTGVYPRVCGGTGGGIAGQCGQQGLSPRVRGNRPAEATGRRLGGSIPACAGEPSVGMAVAGISKVYPRVCGGTAQPWDSR